MRTGRTELSPSSTEGAAFKTTNLDRCFSKRTEDPLNKATPDRSLFIVIVCSQTASSVRLRKARAGVEKQNSKMKRE